MARIALTLCYLIAAVCGPRLCCCAAPVLAKPVQPEKPAPAPPTCPLCAAAEKKAGQPEPAKKHDCPCQKSRPAPHTVPATTFGEDLRLLAADESLGEPVTAINPPVAPDPGRLPRVIGPPPDPSSHLLRLCHRLRC